MRIKHRGRARMEGYTPREKHSYSHQLSMGTRLFVHQEQPEGQKQAVQQPQPSSSHPCLCLRLRLQLSIHNSSLGGGVAVAASVFFRCKRSPSVHITFPQSSGPH